MSRSLDDLDPRFQAKAFELVARICSEVGPILIVDTLRTKAEQEIAVASGNSANPNSLHLTGLAIDLAPWEVWQAHGPDKLQWSTTDPRWRQIGMIGKKLGLRWGGDWRRPNDANFWEYRDPRTVRPYDPGHFEMA